MSFSTIAAIPSQRHGHVAEAAPVADMPIEEVTSDSGRTPSAIAPKTARGAFLSTCTRMVAFVVRNRVTKRTSCSGNR